MLHHPQLLLPRHHDLQELNFVAVMRGLVQLVLAGLEVLLSRATHLHDLGGARKLVAVSDCGLGRVRGRTGAVEGADGEPGACVPGSGGPDDCVPGSGGPGSGSAIALVLLIA
jgi:hypothetical protein